MTDFGEFEDFLKAPPPSLPDSAELKLTDFANNLVTLLVDSDGRLVVEYPTPVYRTTTPHMLTTSSANPIHIQAPQEGYINIITSIDVVNVSSSAVRLYLYFSEEDPPPDTDMIIACGEEVPAHGLFSWRGVLHLESETLFGRASDASALVAFATVRRAFGDIR